jgi:primosomal protein N' (replication factor Y) (superfamily II helicase)
VKVAVARPLLGELTYAVPAIVGDVEVGHVVLVPLGSQGETGYVVATSDEPDFDPARIKPLSRLLDPVPAFDAEQLSFFRWIADYYLVPVGMVIHTALPSGIRAKVVRVLAATDDGVDALTRQALKEDEALVLREVVSRPGLTRRGLQRRLADELEANAAGRTIDALVRAGHADWVEREVGEVKGRARTIHRVLGADPSAVTGKRMLAVLASLGAEARDLSEVLAEHGDAARTSIDRLAQLGLVAYGEREVREPLDVTALGSRTPPVLNADQRAALDALAEPAAKGTFLLFGVTGSGKTEVFLGAAAETLTRGRQVLVLVPEIGLTPQLVGRFKARFGDGVAVLHSGLTGGQRLAEWRRIRAGEANVAVGARSALFAPFHDLGLIVVDEEHDDSYKQDEGVPYNARDLAVVLGVRRQCPVVLASATPSLESWYNALLGRYRLLKLPLRATPQPVPVIQVVDLLAVDVPEGVERPLLAPIVEGALRDTFASGGQAIVLYNRRGYATMVECSACGSSYDCPNCGISLTLHKRAHAVTCHYCGLKLPYSGVCPVCGAPEMDEAGKGTERVEEQLAALFPDVRIGRMDADTTTVRGAHERILDAFRAGQTQMLVGTQIIAKGHDFPGVHTAVVIGADRSIRLPDFRSAERTMSLLVQLAGRAGRGSVAGQVFVQTWKPDHYVLTFLHNLVGFYDVELKLRSTLQYPPFTRMVLVRLDGVDRRAVVSAAEELARVLRAAARQHRPVGILGPAPAALARLVGRWRFQVVVRSTDTRALRAFLAATLPQLHQAGRKGVRVHWDVDPRSLM